MNICCGYRVGGYRAVDSGCAQCHLPPRPSSSLQHLSIALSSPIWCWLCRNAYITYPSSHCPFPDGTVSSANSPSCCMLAIHCSTRFWGRSIRSANVSRSGKHVMSAFFQSSSKSVFTLCTSVERSFVYPFEAATM